MSEKQNTNEVLSTRDLSISDKDAQKYEQAYARVVKLLGGESLFKSPKVKAGEDVDSLIRELAKEEQEDLKKRFIEGAKKVVNGRRALKKFITQKEQELKKLIVEEMKKSTGEMQTLLGLIDQAANVEKEISESLTEMADSNENTAANPA